jgi:hypothetical protein
MAFANTSISDVIATTIQSRSGALADNVTENNAVLEVLNQKGNVRPFSGGNVILQEIMYGDSSTVNADSYSGYETINTTQNSPISAAQFSIAQYAAAVTISGLEMLQNASKEQIVDLMEGRIQVAEAQLANRIDTDIYGDGTGNSGKNLTGLAAAVTNTGTYGGISKDTWEFWQSLVYDATSDGGGAASATNIQKYMTHIGLAASRGRNKPDLYVASTDYFAFYVASLQAIQRITSDSGSGSAGAGFPSLMFYGAGYGAKVVNGGGIGDHGGTKTLYALNTDYIFLRPHSARNFVPIGGERQAVNQDAIVKLIGWAGNLACSGPRFCALLND